MKSKLGHTVTIYLVHFPDNNNGETKDKTLLKLVNKIVLENNIDLI